MTTIRETLEQGLPYRDELRRLARAILRQYVADDVLEDVLQEVHVDAWTAVEGGVEIRDLRRYLRKLTRHRAADAKREERRRRAAVLLSAEPKEPVDPADVTDVRQRIATLEQALTVREAVLFRSLLRGASIREAAVDAGVKYHTARRMTQTIRELCVRQGLVRVVQFLGTVPEETEGKSGTDNS